MQKHADEAHEGVAEFSVKVLRTHRSAITRQINETVVIKCKTLEGAHLLNSKTEYNRCILPELTVEIGRNKLSEEGDRSKQSQGEFFKSGRKLEEEQTTGVKRSVDKPPNSKRRKRAVQETPRKRKLDNDSNTNPKEDKP